LRLESQLAAASGDPFVLRSYSPMLVIGGGAVVDPHPPKRRKPGSAGEVAEREGLSPGERVMEILVRAGTQGMEFSEVASGSSLTARSLESELGRMQSDGRVREGRRQLWFSGQAVEEMQSSIAARLAQLHGKHPLLVTVPLNDVVAAAASTPRERECFRLALDALQGNGKVVISGDRLRLYDHAPRWSGTEALARQKILDTCRGSGLAVPPVEELAAAAGMSAPDCRRIIDALVTAGELQMLDEGIYVHPEVVERCRARVLSYLEQNGTMTIGQCRELLSASRKFLLPFLEQLDREGLTVRRGDHRVLAAHR
jgi:selenocysteine-specific elongation factor